jgi:HSP20 family molecular chaperone IbpA
LIAVGFFGRGERAADVMLNWQRAGLTWRFAVRDLWQRQARGTFEKEISLPVPVQRKKSKAE